MKNIAIFASHNGTILETLQSASKELGITVSLIISNNQNANVLQKAQVSSIAHFVVNETLCENVDETLDKLLKEHNCDAIILAGYMKKISPFLAKKYFIINSHPALLPKYGGKGMYGRFVHEAVIKNGEKRSGVTVHKVNENYDEGEILCQKELMLNRDETPESLENKIKELEKIAMIEALRLCSLK